MNDVQKNLGKIVSGLKGAVDNKLDKVGYIVENAAKENMVGHNRSGILSGSIHHEVEKNEVLIGTDVEYAPYHHDGHGSFAGNPFLQKAVDANMDKIKAELGNLLEELI